MSAHHGYVLTKEQRLEQELRKWKFLTLLNYITVLLVVFGVLK